MYQSTPVPETSEIEKGLNRLGLSLSESELNQIQMGKTISLEGRCLSEIGSLFLLASAISAVNLGKKINNITFKDLPETITDFPSCVGIPIYCWDSDSLGKCVLCLTVVDGKPGINPCYNLEKTQE